MVETFKFQVPNLAHKVQQTMLTNSISTNQQAMFESYYITKVDHKLKAIEYKKLVN